MHQWRDRTTSLFILMIIWVLMILCLHTINDYNLRSTGETIDRKRFLLYLLCNRNTRSSREYEERFVIFEWDLDSFLHEYMKDIQLTEGRAWKLYVGDAIAACWQETEFEYYVLTKSTDSRLILRTTYRRGAPDGQLARGRWGASIGDWVWELRVDERDQVKIESEIIRR